MSEYVNPGTEEYSMAELITVEMSRNLAPLDGKHGGVGNAANMPAAAVRLAQLTVAPSLTWFCGGSGAINPAFDRLGEGSMEARYVVGAEAIYVMMDVVDLGSSAKRWSFGFSGGMQIDKFGNANMIGIGTPGKLKVRGPGTVGTIWTSTQETYFLYVWHHNRKVFVEKVDFVSSPGFLEGGDSRWKILPRHSKGPTLVYSPICVMDFEEVSHSMRLRSVHPGYNVDDVVANTGFELIIPPKVPMTKPPTELELFLLRTCVDRDGSLYDFRRLTVG